MPGANFCPNLVRGLGVAEEQSVLCGDHTFTDQKIGIECSPPKLLAHKYYGQRLNGSRLNQCEGFENLVQGSKTARERDQCSGSKQEVQLTNSEVVHRESQILGDIGIWILFMRQRDIQANALGASLVSATIRGLHDAGSATGHDCDPRVARSLARLRDQRCEFLCNSVVAALRQDTLSDLQFFR